MKPNIWTRDELILALDAYLNIRPRAPDPSLPEILELSRFLKTLPIHPQERRNENFRTPASVVMKLMNFRSFDPDYEGTGLKATGRMDREIWDEFSQQPAELKKLAHTIKEKGSTDTTINIPEIDDFDFLGITEASEGKILTKEHVYRERNSKIVKKKKDHFLKKHGKLFCEACGFHFEKIYGERGKNFIECHHTIPLCDLQPGSKTKLDDLVLLCSNCHRIVHRKRPWLSFEQLKILIKTE